MQGAASWLASKSNTSWGKTRVPIWVLERWKRTRDGNRQNEVRPVIVLGKRGSDWIAWEQSVQVGVL